MLTNEVAASEPRGGGGTRLLLVAGVVAGPLFVVASLVQAFTRQGFDLRRHAISLLSLGDAGWIQVANFWITGLLVVAGAVGIRRALRSGRARTWGPLLYGAYGVALVAAGIFHPDPASGFPPGTPAGTPTTMSWHGALHDVAFLAAAVSLSVACIVFARRFHSLDQTGWMAYCVFTAAATLLLVALSGAQGGAGLPLLGVAVVLSAGVAALPARFLTSGR